MDLKAQEAALNGGAPLQALGPQKAGSHLTRGKVNVLHARYDFAVQGGAIGAVNLFDAVEGPGVAAKLPKNAIVKQVTIVTNTALNGGGGATVALGVVAANDIKTATGFASYTGVLASLVTGAGGAMIQLGADSTLTATIATAALTAGQVDLLVEFYLPLTA